MSDSYAKSYQRRYLKETKQIGDFLADADNQRIREYYESATADFQLKILSKKKAGDRFDELMEYLYDLLVDRDPILRANRRLTRAMLFYMYWNCDIGEANDGTAL